MLDGRAQNAFAIVRPPGHHAEPEAAMGFCLLNNIAIARRHALSQGIGKALIVDFDVHHGNGTQAVFLDERRVAFLSTQQENIYPFRTGFIEDAPQATRPDRQRAAAGASRGCRLCPDRRSRCSPAGRRISNRR